MEADILIEIRDSEKRADDIIAKAGGERESIVREAIINSSKLLSEKKEETRKLQEKRIFDFREKMKLIKEEKLNEGKNAVKVLKPKSEKNISKAVDFIIKKFEEQI